VQVPLFCEASGTMRRGSDLRPVRKLLAAALLAAACAPGAHGLSSCVEGASINDPRIGE
jgi:hypothetical protein